MFIGCFTCCFNTLLTLALQLAIDDDDTPLTLKIGGVTVSYRMKVKTKALQNSVMYLTLMRQILITGTNINLVIYPGNQ